MRIIVCGGRDFGEIPDSTPRERRDIALEQADRERAFLVSTLGSLGVTEMASGGASGADDYAHQWAIARGIPAQVFRARWKQEGLAAGPIRNARMLAEFKPDAVVAFPGGRGTADMTRKAGEAGVQVIEVMP